MQHVRMLISKDASPPASQDLIGLTRTLGRVCMAMRKLLLLWVHSSRGRLLGILPVYPCMVPLH